MRFRMKILILELLVFTFESFGFDFEDLNGFRNCQFNLDRQFRTNEPPGIIIKVIWGQIDLVNQVDLERMINFQG